MTSTNLDIQRISVEHGLVLVEVEGVPSALKGHTLIFTNAKDNGVLEFALYKGDHETTLSFVPEKKDFPALLQLGKSQSFTVIGTSGTQTESVSINYPTKVQKILTDAVHECYRNVSELNEGLSERTVLLG